MRRSAVRSSVTRLLAALFLLFALLLVPILALTIGLLTPMTAPAAATAASQTINVSCTIRDFHGIGWGSPGSDGIHEHPDFEDGVTGLDIGIVQTTLGSDGKPVYAGDANNPSVHGKTYFDQWYRDTPNVNECVLKSLTFSFDGGNYVYSDSAFFPIDGLGLGNEGRKHNYHFTMELHNAFTYETGQSFSFTGDDDLWLFIDRKLVIDLGGVHEPQSSSVNLDTLGLTAGRTYSFDLFFAERHTTESSFGAATSIVLSSVPPQVLSPVVGPLEMVDASTGACSNKKWCFLQNGSPDTHVIRGGIGLADDKYAWDVNLNTPMWVSDPNWNCDAGKPVYAVAAGVVTDNYGADTNYPNCGGPHGEVLIRHSYQGSVWYSGYQHMTGIRVVPGQPVKEDTVLGYISDVGANNVPNNEHLHFVVYTGTNTSGGLVSFNTTIAERDQGPRVEDVAPGTGKRDQHLTVTVSGSNLNGATAVSFGSGITVSDPSAVSDTEITVEITIEAHADLGKRDVSVTNQGLTATMTDGFEVVGSGVGICSGGVLATPGAPSEMATVMAALGLMFGVGCLLMRKGMKRTVRS